MTGIVTFVNEDNYGAVLQAYAMQTYLNQQGIDTEFLNIRLSRYVKQNAGILRNLFVKFVFFRKKISFWRFRKRLKISRDKTCNTEKYSRLIIGSDQVWNPLLTGNDLRPVFFGEGFQGEVIGYACSCGDVSVLSNYKGALKKYLWNFTDISVRERNLEFFLKNLITKDICTVLDPVFLLDDIGWKEFVDSLKHKRKRPYIFVYLLEDRQEMTEAINELSEKENLGVITLRTKKHYRNEIKRFPGADPEQFLELLFHAEIVLTNSFHAMAFSYIYRKRVALFKHSQFNDRIEHLIALTGLKGNVYYETEKTIVDFSGCERDENFCLEREKSREYLRRNLKCR